MSNASRNQVAWHVTIFAKVVTNHLRAVIGAGGRFKAGGFQKRKSDGHLTVLIRGAGELGLATVA